MGKKRGGRKGFNGNPASRGQITLRQESSGIKQSKGGSKNAKSGLKLEHLRKLAMWSSGEASIPSLGAFFGSRLAALGESMGVLPDPSMLPCQRCEAILLPGQNCTIRIEKNTSKVRQRHKKSNVSAKNDVVFKCHFCSHRNLKRGTPKGHMKQICPAKTKQYSDPGPMNSQHLKPANLEKNMGSKNETDKMAVEIAGLANDSIRTNENDNLAVGTILPAVSGEIPIVESPATPFPRTGVTLLDSKKKRRNRSGTRKPAEAEINLTPTDSEKSAASNKRRRKSWTSLKEIAENGRSRNVTNLTVPFIL